jgi:hypothetical protein
MNPFRTSSRVCTLAAAILILPLAACGSSSHDAAASSTGAIATPARSPALVRFSGTVRSAGDEIRSSDFQWSGRIVPVDISWDCRHAQAPRSFDLRLEQRLSGGPPVEYFTRNLTGAPSGRAVAHIDVGLNSAQHPTGRYYLEVLESSVGCTWMAEVPQP